MFAIDFLRPEWFLGLLPVVVILWQAWQIQDQQGAWHKVIAPPFRKLLLGRESGNTLDSFGQMALLGLGALWLLMVVALAGPTLKTVEIPAQKSQQGTVILLDLSLSMLADDLSPNRLSRVKFKLTDLLTDYPETPTGLVVYAGTAHTLTPISEDNQTLLGLLPALDPTIMPSYGSQPLNAFAMAKTLFDGAHITQGHIIWITDDLEVQQTAELSAWLAAHSYNLSIMAVGTAQGGAVQIPNFGLLKDPQNNVVLPTLPWTQFETLAQQTSAKLTALTVDDRDIRTLLPPQRATVNSAEPSINTLDAEQKSVQHPLDEGSALLLLLIPLAAFIYRRGWIFSLGAVPLLPLLMVCAGASFVSLMPNQAQAQESTQAQEPVQTQLPSFTDVFKSADQQAYQAWQTQNYQAAEAQFEDPQWRASSLYRLGRFNEAAKLFALDPSAQGWFNQGNALAKAGDLTQAKTAYQQSLTLQPSFNAAQENLAIIEKLLAETENTPPQTTSDQQQEPEKPQQESSTEQKTEPSAESNAENNQASDQESNQESNQKSAPETDKNDQENSQENNQASGQESSATGQSTADANSATTEANTQENTQDTATAKLGDADTPGASGASAQDSAEQQAEQAQQAEQNQATEAWLRQIPNQPELFLKRKFDYQYQQQTQSNSPKAKASTPQKEW